VSDDPRQGIKLLIDEDLSPWVAGRLCVERLIDAVHVRDRGVLGSSDREVLSLAFSEDRILVTANVGDFERLARAQDVHGGIVAILHGGLRRAEQLEVMLLAVDALAAEFRAGRDLINRVLRITATGATEFLDLPKPKP
jgi:predicted nuclease of predicted toxin-antitoxin system